MKYFEIKTQLFGQEQQYSDSAEDFAFEIAEMIVDARAVKGITQEELAGLVGTKQPSIARLESGKVLPSFKFLLEVVRALKTKMSFPKIELVEKIKQAFDESTNDLTMDFEKPPTWLSVNETEVDVIPELNSSSHKALTIMYRL